MCTCVARFGDVLAACFHCNRVQLAYVGHSGKLILHHSKICTTEGALRNRFSHAVSDAKMGWGITISNCGYGTREKERRSPAIRRQVGVTWIRGSTCAIGPLYQSNTHARRQDFFIIEPTCGALRPNAHDTP